MWNLLLPAAVAALFAFGWFLMKRLDMFLENNCRMQALKFESDGKTLRIGFSNPLAAGSITDVLEKYSNLCSDSFVRLFHGTEEELIKALSDNELNVIFLPGNAVIPDIMYYNVREVLLSDTPVMTEYGGLSIEPLSQGCSMQKVLWHGETKISFVNCFIACLNDEFAPPAETQRQAQHDITK